jgi:tripartite-type tricarboxylate transporter receptor subunit TctC
MLHIRRNTVHRFAKAGFALLARTSLIFVIFSVHLTLAAPMSGFYTDKTISLYLGVEPGSNYASYGRLLGQFMPKYIPGNPTVVVRYMPGAATLVLANYLYNAAPRDGTAFGLVHERMGLLPLIDPRGIKYDALKFNWIGAMSRQLSVCFVWRTSPIKSIEDAKIREVLVGGTNAGGSSEVFPRVLNQFLGTKFKVVNGYPGTQDIVLAMERGEVDGRCGFGWSALKTTKPDWVAQGKVHVIMQMGMTKAQDLPNVPSLLESVSTPAEKQAVEFLLGSSVMARPFVAPPGVPEDRIKILQRAFDATLRDPEFLKQARAQVLDIDPISGEEIKSVLTGLYATSKPIIETAASWMN